MERLASSESMSRKPALTVVSDVFDGGGLLHHRPSTHERVVVVQRIGHRDIGTRAEGACCSGREVFGELAFHLGHHASCVVASLRAPDVWWSSDRSGPVADGG